jgi:hypothetical protein
MTDREKMTFISFQFVAVRGEMGCDILHLTPCQRGTTLESDTLEKLLSQGHVIN